MERKCKFGQYGGVLRPLSDLSPTVVRPLDSDMVVIRRWKGGAMMGNSLKSSNKKKIDPIADRPSCISSDWKGSAPSLSPYNLALMASVSFS